LAPKEVPARPTATACDRPHSSHDVAGFAFQGDTQNVDWGLLADVDIILTTPEKFDSITRRNVDRGGMSFFGDIALVLIDEVHVLQEERGATVRRQLLILLAASLS
jgi:ATP-dependent DNA helicase HFM1/MER3